MHFGNAFGNPKNGKLQVCPHDLHGPTTGVRKGSTLHCSLGGQNLKLSSQLKGVGDEMLMLQEGGLEAERKERERLVMEEQRKMTESILKVISIWSTSMTMIKEILQKMTIMTKFNLSTITAGKRPRCQAGCSRDFHS